MIFFHLKVNDFLIFQAIERKKEEIFGIKGKTFLLLFNYIKVH
jgi:hypothetical protein